MQHFGHIDLMRPLYKTTLELSSLFIMTKRKIITLKDCPYIQQLFSILRLLDTMPSVFPMAYAIIPTLFTALTFIVLFG